MEQQDQQLIQEKTESKPSIKTNWKFIAIVAVFAFLTIGGVLLLKTIAPEPALSPTPPGQRTPPPAPSPQVLDTSTWQTYHNEEFGFEVRYPITWLFDADVEYGEIPSLDIHISNFGAR